MTAVALKPGTRLYSATCSTQVIVVRAPAGPLEVTCGGSPMATTANANRFAALDPVFAGGTQLGKRYTDGQDLELLVTKGGEGTLAVGDEPLAILEPKRLPSSD